MVNDEYLDEVRRKFGKCKCGKDVEYVILQKNNETMYHINSFGDLSKRYNIPCKRKKTGKLLEALCHQCYLKAFEQVENNFQEVENARAAIKNFTLIEKLTDLEENVLKTVKAHVPKEIIDDNNQVDPECLIFDINNNFKAFLEGLNDGC